MRKTIPYLALIATGLLFSCGQSKHEKSEDQAAADTLTHQQCYKAVYEKDSADLTVETLASGKVKGKLVVNYQINPKNTGVIDGAFKGDTLYVDYSFKTGKDTVSVYTNPLVFLKKDGKLIMGVGQIETSLGRSYFVKGKPINFERGKFVFEPTDCK